MTVLKRVISVLLCVVLAAAAVLLANGTQEVHIGRGDGQNESIVSLEEFHALLTSADAEMKLPEGLTLASAEDGIPEDGQAVLEDAYKSMTMTETSDLYSSSSSDSRSSSSGGSSVTTTASASVTFRRKLIFAYTPDAVYYRSEGRLVSSSESETVSRSSTGSVTTTRQEKTYFDFALDIFIDAERVLIKADRRYYYKKTVTTRVATGDSSNNSEEVDYDEEEVIRILQEHLGEWLDCTKVPSVVYSFTQITDMNLQTLSSLGETVEEGMSEGGAFSFRREDERYFLDNETMKEMMGVPDDFDDFNGEFSVDLTDAYAPTLSYMFYGGNSAEESSESVSSSFSSESNVNAHVRDHFLFENIGNTVVSMPEGISGIDMSELLGEENE